MYQIVENNAPNWGFIKGGWSLKAFVEWLRRVWRNVIGRVTEK